MKREFQINFVYNDDPLAERWEGRFIDADKKDFTDFVDSTPFIQEFTDGLRVYIEQALKPKETPPQELSSKQAWESSKFKIEWPDGPVTYWKVAQNQETGEISEAKNWGKSVIADIDLAERLGFQIYAVD